MKSTERATESMGPLDSLQGIRWLLLVGALVMAVSVYRLVESQWAGMSVVAQFLTLALGVLSIFAAGEVTSDRLRLAQAGSTLRLLFSVLVPVLAWGAAYLGLLGTVGGSATFGVTMVVLLAAFRRALYRTSGYREWPYVAAFSVLTLSLPLATSVSSNHHLAASLVLGAVFYFGARHINRFFFHRDRQDRIERPLQALPFVALAVLYVAALGLLPLAYTDRAVPLAILGAALIATGDEYFQALVRATRQTPARWPARSAVLLAAGFSAMAVAAPLSFLDPTRCAVAVVFTLSSAVLIRWSLRYQHSVAHAAGMLAAIVGYQTLPSLFPGFVTDAFINVLRSMSLDGTVSLVVVAHIGLVLAFLLTLPRLAGRLQRTQALVTSGYAALVVTLAMFDDVAAMLVVPLAIVLALVGHRYRHSPLIIVGLGALSMGLHRHLGVDLDGSTPMLVTLNFALFAGAVGIARLVAIGRLPSAWNVGATLSILAHGALGIGWLLVAMSSGTVSIEPFIIVLFGVAMLDHATRSGYEWGTTAALGLLVLYAPFQLWTISWLTSLPVALWIVFLGLIALRISGRWPVSLGWLMRAWEILAFAVAVSLAGTESLGLATVLCLVRAREGRLPLRSLLLVLLHLHILVSGVTDGWFPIAVLRAWAEAFPLAAVLATAWIVLVEARGRAELGAWTLILEALTFFGLTLSCIVPGRLDLAGYGALLLVALVLAARHGVFSVKLRSREHAWATEAWLLAGTLVGYGAGWIHFGSGRAPYIFLATGVLQYGLARLAARQPDIEELARTSLLSAQGLALVAGLVALARVASHTTTYSVWSHVLPLFLASLFYLLVASTERPRTFPAVLSAAFLGCGLFAVGLAQGVGSEFYALAPGFSLVALSVLLSEEMGPRLCRHVFTAGAAFIYATPVLALYDEITWSWQAILLLMTVGFGSASFYLRSRPLLTISTAALVVDLACFVIKVRATEPLLLWAAGLVLGVSLMSLATFLEYRREGLAQRLRVYGRELSLWY